MNYLAPAGTPVAFGDLLTGLTARGGSAQASLAEWLCRWSGHPFAAPVSSGRAAMTILLRSMGAQCPDRDRDEVIIPAYTCYSVPAAVERAGLRPRLCDVDPATLSIDPESLARRDFSRVLAVVSANLYGLPDDLEAIESICRERGVFMLDDAAQALGARLRGRPVGAFGDAGLYSFDKGKIISTIQGGAIVCRGGEFGLTVEQAAASLPPPALADRALNLARMLAYVAFLRPSLYGFVRALPFTGIGTTIYETRYSIARLSGFQMALADLLIRRVPELNAGRRRHAATLDEVVREFPGIEAVAQVPGSEPVYARFPLRVREPRRRAKLLAAFDRAGIGATASYPLALADVPEVTARLPAADRNCPGAREVARTLLTLPTHAHCPPDLGERVRDVIHSCTI